MPGDRGLPGNQWGTPSILGVPGPGFAAAAHLLEAQLLFLVGAGVAFPQPLGHGKERGARGRGRKM